MVFYQLDRAQRFYLAMSTALPHFQEDIIPILQINGKDSNYYKRQELYGMKIYQVIMHFNYERQNNFQQQDERVQSDSRASVQVVINIFKPGLIQYSSGRVQCCSIQSKSYQQVNDGVQDLKFIRDFQRKSVQHSRWTSIYLPHGLIYSVWISVLIIIKILFFKVIGTQSRYCPRQTLSFGQGVHHKSPFSEKLIFKMLFNKYPVKFLITI